MDLTPHVEQIRAQLAIAAEAGGEDARALAERLTAPLESGVRLTPLDAPPPPAPRSSPPPPPPPTRPPASSRRDRSSGGCAAANRTSSSRRRRPRGRSSR